MSASVTDSEKLFEEYLTEHGYNDWQYEHQAKGKKKTPDYRLFYAGKCLYFEVKEFDLPPPTEGYGYFDPYRPIREKINQAVRQFKEYEEYSCSVVLANIGEGFVHLDRTSVLGAMFGNLGFRVELGVAPSKSPPEQIFMSGGKMINDKRREPQNTTVSSIVVLSRYPLRQKSISLSTIERESRLGRPLALDELSQLIESCPCAEEENPVRVAVYENPYARIPLPRDLFTGSYDERWGIAGERIRLVFQGERLAEVESRLNADSDN